MSPLLRLIYGLWLLGAVLQVILLAGLVSRRVWRQFPVFTTYLAFGVLQNALCYLVRGNPWVYVYVYWITQSIALILELGVIYELFTKFLLPYPALHGLARVALRSTIGILLLVSICVDVFHAPVQGHKLVAGFVVLEQAARISQVGLLVFLFSFSRIFGLHWRQHVFGLGLGLAFYATVDLVGVTMRAHFGVAAFAVFNVADMVAWSCSSLIWISYLLARERVALTAEMPKRAQLEQWNQAIMELIHQ